MLAVVFENLASAQSNTPVKMPSGPNLPGRFGAYYTTLEFEKSWDDLWRTGEHADVVVRFDTGGQKFVFWRGTSYIPCWVTDNGVWYTNAFVERSGKDSPNTQGCCEPMSDKQCRYSHVRIIENTDARAVIHWRYAPVDVHYNHPFIDPETGWSDWVDEYYYLYPDATGTRKITVYSSKPEKWIEWQEAIVLNQPGTMPEDNIERAAVSAANIKGESKTFTWTEQGAPSFRTQPVHSNIIKINLRSSKSPFIIIPTSTASKDPVITPYEGHGKGSIFNFWDHWPVSADASDGRLAESAQRPSHSSLLHIAHQRDDLWPFYEQSSSRHTKIMLHGMTDLDVTKLVPLAKSWENPPELKAVSGDYNTIGYNQSEKAYYLEKTGTGIAPLTFSLSADQEHPVINPVFVVRNWGDEDVWVKLDDKDAERAKVFRFGHRHSLTSTDLIVWLRVESVKELSVTFQPHREKE